MNSRRYSESGQVTEKRAVKARFLRHISASGRKFSKGHPLTLSRSTAKLQERSSRSDALLNRLNLHEALREVSTDRLPVILPSLGTPDAIGVVVAHAVHHRQNDSSPVNDSQAVLMAEALLDTWRNYRPFGCRLLKISQPVLFASCVANNIDITRLCNACQKRTFQIVGAPCPTVRAFDVVVSFPAFIRGRAVLFVPQNHHFSSEPFLTVRQESTVVLVLFFDEGVDDQHVVGRVVREPTS